MNVCTLCFFFKSWQIWYATCIITVQLWQEKLWRGMTGKGFNIHSFHICNLKTWGKVKMNPFWLLLFIWVAQPLPMKIICLSILDNFSSMAIHKFIIFLAQRGHIFQYANKNWSILCILSTLRIPESSHTGVRLRIILAEFFWTSKQPPVCVWVPGWFLGKLYFLVIPSFTHNNGGDHHGRGVWILFCWPPWRSLDHDPPRLGPLTMKIPKRRMEI